MLKYKNHPSIFAIQNKFKVEDVFYFRKLEKVKIEKEIHKLNNNKASNILKFSPKLLRATLTYLVTFCT